MNEHLSTTQISERLAGDRSGQNERHLQHCAACRSEVAAFETGLAALGQSIRYWAAQQDVTPSSEIDIRRSPARLSWRWVPASVVIGAAVFLPVHWNLEARREAARQEDAKFLESVDTQLSRAVPASMEPLMNLMQQGKDEHE